MSKLGIELIYHGGASVYSVFLLKRKGLVSGQVGRVLFQTTFLEIEEVAREVWYSLVHTDCPSLS